ncbi:acryloyl-CoA reductase [Fervidibacillus halotolerans]|uniref:Acryloyl-CoA reductase n=1 Tax=Fervidibacillus halotolerans TaxID=2980027 RepID=A0A9E8M1N7_9BACI|nr:acryloyl-CoA reductase [Fervidibacillus halotolerans]WAA13327.1 acryloyl-CoA reductase [Fervidibacillus halotolerans]
MEKVRVYMVDQTENGFQSEIKRIQLDELPDEDVTISVHYSSVNYKDGLASIPNGGIVRNYPFVPGIDLAGVVIESKDPRYKEGDEVIVTGYELGVSHFGGYSEIARVPADWIVPLPEGLSLKEAMGIGTAGFTAALSIQRLEENDMRPGKGPVLVTGATGGVGSMAVAMLNHLGYEVYASTRSESKREYLINLGAKEVLSTSDLTNPKQKALLKQRWQAAVDPVAGDFLSTILASIQYGGSVAVSGLTGGNHFQSTVYPFILRGVNLLGIDSVYCPMDQRLKLWNRIGNEMKPRSLDQIMNEIAFSELPEVLSKILKGETDGRNVVSIGK